MIVVADTSPLNYLVLVQYQDVLPALFGRVLAPPAVIAELRHPGAPPAVRSWASTPPPWLEVRTPVNVDPDVKLGPGEAEAISLARELKADVVLIDERKAFTVARECGLFVTGTLGVLAIAAEKGLVSLPEVLAALRRTSFRVSREVLDELLGRGTNSSGESHS
jgi:predicted nucleic acid-binding protein